MILRHEKNAYAHRVLDNFIYFLFFDDLRIIINAPQTWWCNNATSNVVFVPSTPLSRRFLSSLRAASAVREIKRIRVISASVEFIYRRRVAQAL